MKTCLRGVNLGGWLLLERWMTPSVFSVRKSVDEFGLMHELGEAKFHILKLHRDSFITEDDFAKIAESGYRLVRIPIGFWNFKSQDGFVSTKKYLDYAIYLCNKYDLKYIIQIHSAPGSQNGEITSGIVGDVRWHTSRANIKHTLDFLKQILVQYGNDPNLFGVGLLNEPSRIIPNQILFDYYKQAVKLFSELGVENSKIIISDQFRPFKTLISVLRNKLSKDVTIDTHPYLIHTHFDKTMPTFLLVIKTIYRGLIVRLISLFCSIIVGEYSYRISKYQKNEKVLNYFQEWAYQGSSAKIIWSYKSETNDAWQIKDRLQA